MKWFSDLISETYITFSVAAIRLFMSLMLGSIIGLERERHNQPAGFRTHALIAIGSTMIMLLSIFMAQAFNSGSFATDPGRIAAQVVSGIGFLGAGAILRMGVSVKGVTTAASIWVVAALGLVVGAGMYGTALMSTGFILIVLTVFDRFEKMLFVEKIWRSIIIELGTNQADMNKAARIFSHYRIDVQSSDISQTIGEKNIKVRYIVKIPKDVDIQKLFLDLKSIKGILKINLKSNV